MTFVEAISAVDITLSFKENVSWMNNFCFLPKKYQKIRKNKVREDVINKEINKINKVEESVESVEQIGTGSGAGSGATVVEKVLIFIGEVVYVTKVLESVELGDEELDGLKVDDPTVGGNNVVV